MLDAIREVTAYVLLGIGFMSFWFALAVLIIGKVPRR